MGRTFDNVGGPPKYYNAFPFWPAESIALNAALQRRGKVRCIISVPRHAAQDHAMSLRQGMVLALGMIQAIAAPFHLPLERRMWFLSLYERQAHTS